MVKSPCGSGHTKKDKTWNYIEYYVGDRDVEERKDGQGRNHWTGAKVALMEPRVRYDHDPRFDMSGYLQRSNCHLTFATLRQGNQTNLMMSIEWYTGRLLRGTMHGAGEYRWRHIGDDGTHFSYEGHFYCNSMHGYGTMSYPDGRVFTGLFHSNIRWGPGIQSHACLREDVGLWRGRQLIRLAWRPATPSIAPDLYSNNIGKACLDTHRVKLTEKHKKIGETNSALDLLKQYGADPMTASEKWNKLYPKNCTDLASSLCFVNAFEHNYYKGKIHLLEELSCPSQTNVDPSQDGLENSHNISSYYAWNNNPVIIHMMKHSYTHEEQRNPLDINIERIVSGPRKQFKMAGKHELDCRSLLMASFLGHTKEVVELVNDGDIHPDISDSLGNSAVMYATCGEHEEIIHFLIEAGASVDGHNDSGCTPLGVALLRFACAQNNISPNDMLQAVLPPPDIPAPSPVQQNIFEWNFGYIQTVSPDFGGLPRSPSKLNKSTPIKKGLSVVKSSPSLKSLTNSKKKTDITSSRTKLISINRISDESICKNEKMYNSLISEFEATINELFLRPSGVNPIPYLFKLNNIFEGIDTIDEEVKRTTDKNQQKVPKALKDTIKPSKEVMWQDANKVLNVSIINIERLKTEMLARMLSTIQQLLSDGADPNLVRCPQPALLVAIMSGCPELVKNLVKSGANTNEIYQDANGYTPLDIAVSRQFTSDYLDMLRAVLEGGAATSHRLPYEEFAPSDPLLPKEYGPTLLHSVLARKTDYEFEDEVKNNALKILLDYNCNPLMQFKGRSAIDVAMSKSMSIFNVFIKNPKTNLNTIINDSNQTALVKMFSLAHLMTIQSSERLARVRNLLLYGADPLMKCMNGTEKYLNILVFTLKTLKELETSHVKPNYPASSSNKSDAKKAPASRKETMSSKTVGIGADDAADYKQAIDLTTEYARTLHVRWLQASLMKELVQIINRYKHRHWNNIIKEHKHKRSTGLWLTPQRCLEIWDLMRKTRRKIYNDDKVLKHLLSIVQYYNSSKKRPSIPLTAEQKNCIDQEIGDLLKNRVNAKKLISDTASGKLYEKPELTPKADEQKFKICFECALPFDRETIECGLCKLVSFCCYECMKKNIERENCHPCSDYLRAKYFPVSLDNEMDVNV